MSAYKQQENLSVRNAVTEDVALNMHGLGNSLKFRNILRETGSELKGRPSELKETVS